MIKNLHLRDEYFITKSFLFVMIAFLLIPDYLSQLHTGLDPSWVYGINSFTTMGYKYGSDIVFTYGPLGFLTGVIDVGKNIFIYTIFWSILYLYTLFLIGRFLLNKNNSVSNVALCSLIFFVVYMRFQFGSEQYLIMVFMLTLSSAYFEKTNKYFYMVNCVLVVVFFYIKFSLAINVLSAVLTFQAINIFTKRIDNKYLLICTGLIPVLFIVSFLTYNPSISGLVLYVRGAIEISSGYNVAMSLFPKLYDFALAIIVAYLWLLLFILLFKIDENKFWYLLLFSGPLFFSFKHGFVRADGHIAIFFAMSLTYLFIIILNIDANVLIKNRGSIQKKLSKILVLLLILPTFSSYSPITKIPVLYENKFNSLLNFNQRLNNPFVGDEITFSQEFLDKIGDKSVTIFPWDILYAEYNNLNYKPLPCIQAYSAYTPYLDKLNAEFLSGTESPEYIIFSNKTIDGRFSLIEVPQTWEAIYRNYSAIDFENGYFLLERSLRDRAAYSNVELANFKTSKNETITIPQSDKLIVAKIDMELSLIGKVMKFLFQVPAVYMNMTFDHGQTVRGRIIPEVLSEGVILNSYPYFQYDINLPLMLNKGATFDRVAGFSFEGKRAMPLYKKNVTISFIEVEMKGDTINEHEAHN